ncbi:HYR domain-containing protein [Lacibacter luteus]|uniref:HYR domain-containing protein n=1 Tax=Lacibacter luteus TaxID=2508719 RepID=A0A4V1M781_9BACT|nr:HYR domain-containing protein [Lacibacter luteus]RXK58718.1 HYR domain-containing protein [Lacibacter luteus]
MRKILLSISIVLISVFSYSQVQETWVFSHIGELRDQAVDANGNTYLVSSVYSQAFDAFGTLTIKHNKDGAEVWRFFNPTLKVASAMTLDASGNVYIAGITSTSGSNPSFFGSNRRFCVAKLNSNGVLQWNNIYSDGENDVPQHGYPRSIVVDGNGNPYVTGTLYYLTDPVDSSTYDYATIKYDGATGNRLWLKRYNGSTPGSGFDEAKAMVIDAFGYVYVTGTSQLNGYMDIATVKYDPAGNEIWVQRYSNPNPAYKNDFAVIGGVKLDPAGNVIVIGSSKEGGDVQGSGGEGKGLLIKYTFSGFQLWVIEEVINFFSPGPVITDNGNNIIVCINGYTKKFNASGSLLWTHPEDFGDLAVDASNNIYGVSRCGRQDLCFDRYGLTTMRINSGGTLAWEKTYTILPNGVDRIGLDGDNNVYSSIDRSLASDDYYTIRYSQCEIQCPSNITVNAATGTCGAVVTYPAATTSGDCGSTITYSHAPGSTFPVGTTTVTVTSTETGATCTFDITVVDNQNPVINYCPPSKSVDMSAGVCYATSDAVNAGTATATDNCSATVEGTRSDGKLLTDNYPAGNTTITWKATDPAGNFVTCSQTITVVDNQPPVISSKTSSTYVLSPPNHSMRDVTINYTATDNCAITTTVTVGSNEPVNGVGDGDTDPDYIVLNNVAGSGGQYVSQLQLRAERSAAGSGRVYTVTITATDPSGNTDIETIEIHVAHDIKKPHSGQAFKVGSTVSFLGEFWDKPGNRHTAKWIIDESTVAKATVTEPAGNKNGTVTGSYKFTTPGVYKLRMEVTDQNGVTHYATTAGDLEAIVVIYDPNGGYTYGGGYFNSPAGALQSNPTAIGKASYGFAMNYFKNSTYPKGETQFEFKVGSFEFNALNFEYLAINNSTAQFKGTGKITGGQSGVAFTMTIVDGQLDGTGVDKIRMKIYNKNNGAVYYDNQPGASDAALPTQAVGANSVIVIGGGIKQSSYTNSEMPVVSLETNLLTTKLEVGAFPNPHNGTFSLSVQSPTAGKMTIEYFTMTGARIHIIEQQVKAHEQFVVPNTGLKFNGTVFYKVSINGAIKTGKIIGIN